MKRISFQFANRGLVLKRSPMSATGVTLGDGTPIVAVEQLPDHAIELHVFANDHGASAFVEGFRFAGAGNDIAMDYAPGIGMHRNNHVVVARFSEPRPDGRTIEDCIAIFDHPVPGHEIKSIAATVEKAQQQRVVDHQEADRASAPIRDIAKSKDWTVSRFGTGFVQIDKGRDIGGTIEWKDPNGALVYEEIMSGIMEGSLDISDRLRAIVRRAGFDIDADGVEARTTIPSIAALPSLLDRIEQLALDLADERKQAFHEAFCASFKLTPTRRKLIAAAVENDGIWTYVHRGHMRGTLNGSDVSGGELQQMMQRGWLIKEGKKFLATAEGREAIGLSPEAEAPGPRQ